MRVELRGADRLARAYKADADLRRDLLQEIWLCAQIRGLDGRWSVPARRADYLFQGGDNCHRPE
jgi:hypothetical protein